MFDALFLRHPRSVGESYFEHLWIALTFAARLGVAAIACLVHAMVPALFQKTASRIIAALHADMITGRRRHELAASAFDYAI